MLRNPLGMSLRGSPCNFFQVLMVFFKVAFFKEFEMISKELACIGRGLLGGGRGAPQPSILAGLIPAVH